MKKGQVYEGIIETVEFPNKAVISCMDTMSDGKEAEVKVSAKGGIPGQKVSFVVKKARREKCKGRILEILEKSPLETEQAVCSKFGICGGCNYQTLPYEKQLELKKNQVLKLIDEVILKHESRIKQNDPENGLQVGHEKSRYIYDGILPSPDLTAYRNKMEFSFGDERKDGPLTLGLHKKGSFHDIVDAECCQIVHEDFTKILVCVRDYCREKAIPFYKKNTHEGILRHLLIRRSKATGELLAALVVSSQRMPIWGDLSYEEIWSELTERLKKIFPGEGKFAGFLLMINDSFGDVVQSDRTELLYGKDYIMEKILGLQFKITLFSFFQTNSKGAEVLYQRARDYIVGNFNDFTDEGYFADSLSETSFYQKEDPEQNLRNQTIFDLYSGTGTIAQMIASIAKKVIGVEIVEEAVEAARENMKLNGITNCEFIAGDVLKVIDEIPEKPDVILLDPPREGIHPKALKKIIEYGVEKIVYISCKPTSLARDLEVFLENGYVLKRVSNMDMFVGTVHVETVVGLQRIDM